MPLRFFLLFYSLFLMSCSDNDTKMMGNDSDQMDDMDTMVDAFEDTLRIASYNISMFGSAEGQIADRMNQPNQYTRYKRIAAVIQRVRPDILVLMEFDYDASGEALKNFNDKLLSVSQAGDSAIHYDYDFQIISNTGVLSGLDLDGNGDVSLPEDAFGFGNFPGQYASAVLSRFPLDTSALRSYRNFLWRDMPGALLPQNSDGSSYYSQEALDLFRLSSKNHVDLPVILTEDETLHLLISHPTPPVFDGDEDRNGKRNHDEIRLWVDHINNASYLTDDLGQSGGLPSNAKFVVLGDLNADPKEGDSYNNAIMQLLTDPKINQEIALGTLIPSSNGGLDEGSGADPENDTSFFGLRIDYVLPSSNINGLSSGVFWPSENEDLYAIVTDRRASDHLLVWVDLTLN